MFDTRVVHGHALLVAVETSARQGTPGPRSVGERLLREDVAISLPSASVMWMSQAMRACVRVRVRARVRVRECAFACAY
jgi:hypothetical protein